MYLAKFFHRAPGDDDRELLLIADTGSAESHVLFGFVMNGRSEPYLRRSFAAAPEAVAAFRRAVTELREAGYAETVHTQYQLRALPPAPEPKPAWQQGLDELLLSAMVDDAAGQSALIDELAATPAAQEPFYLWLAARHQFAIAPNHARVLARAENARDTLGARRASKRPPYVWSLRPLKVEAFIQDLLCEIHFSAGRPHAALDAAEHAQEVDGNPYRGGRIAWILCHCFPAREEEAFDQAARYAGLGGYDAITALPAYAAYVERRAPGSVKAGSRSPRTRSLR